MSSGWATGLDTTVLAYLPSPAQGVWHLGPVPIRAYALCIIAGIIAALLIGDRRWVDRGGEPGVIYDVALWAVPFGLVGGRLYHVMTDWQTYFGDGGAGLAAAFRIWDGGLGIWGAVALGALGAWIACRRRGIPLPAFGDAIAPGIILAQAIGRLGNYFNQELYGRPTTLPWGLEIFERRTPAGIPDSLNGVSTGRLIEVVHPTFLYELLWNVAVFVVLLWLDRRFRLGHGRLFASYVALYCVGRFWVELMRSDYATHIAGIRVNTFTSTFIFIAAAVYVMAARRGREDPESLRGDPPDDAATAELQAGVLAVAAGTGLGAAVRAATTDTGPDAAEPGKAVSDTAVSDAAVSGSAVSDTAVADTAEPATAVADTAAPVAGEPEAPAGDEPAEGVPVGAESGTDKSGTDEPGTAQPGTAESGTADSGTPEPGLQAGTNAVDPEEAETPVPETTEPETTEAPTAQTPAPDTTGTAAADGVDRESAAADETVELVEQLAEVPSDELAEAEEFAAAADEDGPTETAEHR